MLFHSTTYRLHYLFHNHFLCILERRYKCKNFLHPHKLHHFYMDSIHTHQYLKSNSRCVSQNLLYKNSKLSFGYLNYCIWNHIHVTMKYVFEDFFVNFKLFVYTYFTILSSVSWRTSTSVWVDFILACSSILTWIG